MNIRILRKINNRIRIRKNGKSFIVEQREKKYLRKNDKSRWVEFSSHRTLKNALKSKHKQTFTSILRKLGYRQELTHRFNKRNDLHYSMYNNEMIYRINKRDSHNNELNLGTL